MSRGSGAAASIEAVGLARRFGDFVAVSDVSFTVDEGEIFGYLGANGAGKSTTIRMLTGLLAPSAGWARVAGFDVARDPEAVKANIGYMSQKFSLYRELPVGANLAFFGGAYGLDGATLRGRVAHALEVTHLTEHAQAVTGALPGGIQQRVALAGAILHGPRIVFLDEPTAGVDPASRRDFWRLIRGLAEQGTTVFVTTHYMDEAEYCDRVGLMVDGRLVALDTPAALKSTHVPGAVFSVQGEGLVQAVPAVHALDGVLQVERVGAAFHVRMTLDRADPEVLRACCVGAGVRAVSVEVTESTLEDVFLEVVRRASGRRETGAGDG